MVTKFLRGLRSLNMSEVHKTQAMLLSIAATQPTAKRMSVWAIMIALVGSFLRSVLRVPVAIVATVIADVRHSMELLQTMTVRQTMAAQRGGLTGQAQASLGMIIVGVLSLVFGTILADVVIDTTTTALTNASIGSFAGASAIGGLIPFIYFSVVIMSGVGMLGLGAISGARGLRG